MTPVPTVSKDQVVLYFPHRTRPILVREVREAERRGEQPEWFALQQLLAGPHSPEARPVFGEVSPENQVFIGSKVIEGDLTLILTRPGADALAGAGDLLSVYALVDTLGSFPRVKSVHFSVEGQPESLRVSGIDLSQPMKPRWDLVDGAKGASR